MDEVKVGDIMRLNFGISGPVYGIVEWKYTRHAKDFEFVVILDEGETGNRWEAGKRIGLQHVLANRNSEIIRGEEAERIRTLAEVLGVKA